MPNRIIRICWLHTKEKRHHRRQIDPKRPDHTRQIQPHRVLWSQESFYATGLVGCRRAVPVTIRSKAFRKEKATLGTFSAWRFVHWLRSERSSWVQLAGHRDGYYRFTHHSSKPCWFVRAETYSGTSPHGWDLLAEQDFRLSGRHGKSSLLTSHYEVGNFN
jgi:hypothetical protein